MGASGTPAIVSRVAHDLDLGTLGVRVFFVISGFLITTLLADEWQRTHDISLGRFYLRRTMRIFPPFYAYVAAVAVLELLRVLATNPGDYLYAVTYTMNFHGKNPGWFLGHSWSLSIEEQFYLLWPAVLVMAGKRRAVWVLVAVLVVVPVLRVGSVLGALPWIENRGQSFATVADWLAAGALLALWRSRLHGSARYAKLVANPLTPWALVAVIFAGWTAFDHWRVVEATATFAVVATALLLDAVVTHPEHGLARAMNTGTLMFIGRISYSLYLWQELFCNRNTTAWPARFPVNVVLSVACATASFYLIEKPALRLRDRMELRTRGRAAR